MRDFAELTERVLRGLGKAYAASAQVLNAPGRSKAVKIDHLSSLALWPAFAERIGRYAGILPGALEEALVLEFFADKTPPLDSSFTPAARVHP